jgi:hypothetical protein
MAARRRARRAAFILVATIGLPAAACNALTGAHDRQLDEGDLDDARNPRVDASDASIDVVPAIDVDVPDDGAPGLVFIEVSKNFSSPNGAVFTTDEAGTVITVTSAIEHAVIVPVPAPNITAEDYTVYATVRAPTNGEFGVLTRLQTDGGAAVLFGSKFGTENKPFLGTMGPPDYNPSLDGRGAAYTWTADARYNFRLKAVGNMITGKFWDATQPEPALFQAVYLGPFATGRGIGFYTFKANGAVLESMRVSIP